jgi:hypothetical protein
MPVYGGADRLTGKVGRGGVSGEIPCLRAGAPSEEFTGQRVPQSVRSDVGQACTFAGPLDNTADQISADRSATCPQSGKHGRHPQRAAVKAVEQKLQIFRSLAASSNAETPVAETDIEVPQMPRHSVS